MDNAISSKESLVIILVTALRMTCVAVQAVIDVVPDTSVFAIRPRPFMLVAVGANETAVVGCVGVAIHAGRPLALVRAAVDGEVMSKHCAGPSRGGVAGLARRWEPCRPVIRIRDGLIGGAVAVITGCGRPRVAVVHVTIGALDIGVGPGQRESRQTVIEDGPAPLRRAMTELAVLREAARRVVRQRRLVVLGQVAGSTGRA